MRILFDQGTPLPLRRLLIGHSVETAFEKGWATLDNGDLLSAAENASYELFVTTDQNLRYQQNLKNRRMAILVLQRPDGRRFVLMHQRLSPPLRSSWQANIGRFGGKSINWSRRAKSL
jgi:hypothetical protein